MSGVGGTIRANGIRQHYLHFEGSGPRVLIVPGIISPAILWRDVATWLAQTHDCFVLDVRGRGLSESGPHLDYGVDACAADVTGFIQAMQLGPTTLIGHSMGARIALRAAAQNAGLIQSVVLVDPPTSGPGRRPYPIPLQRTLALLRSAHRGEAAQAVRAGAGALWPEPLQRLRAEWLCTCDERAVYAAYEDFHIQDMFSDLAKAQARLSLICAGEGNVVSDEDMAEMLRLRPDLSTTRLHGAGHQMQAEDFPGFTRVLAAVLAGQAQADKGKKA